MIQGGRSLMMAEAKGSTVILTISSERHSITAWAVVVGSSAPRARTTNTLNTPTMAISSALPTPSERSSSSTTNVGSAAFEVIKNVVSMIFILFCVVVISAAIFTKQTTATAESGVQPILALFTFWFLLMWLAMLEGGLNCTVGLQPIDKTLYEESHPRTYRCTKASHQGDNIERFIVGRQYMDLMIVFITSFMVSTIDGASVLGLPEVVNNIFLGSDLAVIICTIVFGQLIAQINSANSMLDFMNNWVMVGSTYVALFVESSGILHAVYFVQIVFTRFAGKTIESREPPKSSVSKTLFWLRILFSLAISAFAIAVFMTALMGGNTPVREQIPKSVSIISLLVLLLLGGFMEALQIAFFAVKHIPADRVQASPYATRILHLIFQQGKLEAFLVGRQIAQTVIMFLIARIITVDMKPGQENLFGVSDGVQAFFNSGVLNALVSTIFASLSWRVTANAFPMLFLSNPIAIWIIRLCLVVEGTGICDAAWTFAKIHQWVVRYRPDTMFVPMNTLGMMEESSSSFDNKDDVDVESGTTKKLQRKETTGTALDSDTGSGSDSDDRDESDSDEASEEGVVVEVVSTTSTTTTTNTNNITKKMDP